MTTQVVPLPHVSDEFTKRLQNCRDWLRFYQQAGDRGQNGVLQVFRIIQVAEAAAVSEHPGRQAAALELMRGVR